jgi:hypothetical protein
MDCIGEDRLELEYEAARPAFDAVQFADFVASHGFGDPTPEGYNLGLQLYAAGDDYATIGAEVTARGLVKA